MITDEITRQIAAAFAHEPTPEQQRAMEVFARFLTDRSERVAMVMRGSAGTGKTSLAAAMVRVLTALGRQPLLLAPTGRAAKVFALNTAAGGAAVPAYTIHRQIYRQKTMDAGGGTFSLNFNRHKDRVFMVDEASMIADGNPVGSVSQFGSGNLLDDLVDFVFSGVACKLMLIGDHAQLPPVGASDSPALRADVLRRYGLTVYECELSEVLRQSRQSGILLNATSVRVMQQPDRLAEGLTLPKVRFAGFADIRRVPGDELIEQLNSSYAAVGMDETMVITRSNKRANVYNQGIRNTVLGREDELTTGDWLMVVKNNYFWTQTPTDAPPAGQAADTGVPTFLANGDRARVLRVRHVRTLYGFRFADLLLTFPDYDDYELQATVLTDTLQSDAPSLTREQSDLLYNNVMEDYADLPRKADRMKRLREDTHFNALQVKFAYAVTCHKAQGGQWAHVYVDQGYMTDDMLSPDYLRWLYTAFTRATEQLFLVNWPKNQIEEDHRG